WKYSPSKSFVLNFNWILLSLTLRAFIAPLPRSNVTFCAGPRVSTTVSGDGDIALGSIIVPLHVNCHASSANAAMLKKAMISDAIMLVRNIDKAHLGSDVELRDPNFETSGDSLHSRNRGQKEAQKPRQCAPALALRYARTRGSGDRVMLRPEYLAQKLTPYPLTSPSANKIKAFLPRIIVYWLVRVTRSAHGHTGPVRQAFRPHC